MTKQKTCKNKDCKKKFTPERPMQTVCCFECGIAYAKQLKEKREAKKKTEARVRIREFKNSDITTLKAKAQSAFNRYIRLRDKGNKCISCGANVIKGDASHFFSVGSHSAVRFNTDNVHLSCYKCNRFLHGNLIPYKSALIEKIGIERFKVLEAQSKDTKKYNSEYYNRIIKIFNKKSKKLK